MPFSEDQEEDGQTLTIYQGLNQTTNSLQTLRWYLLHYK